TLFNTLDSTSPYYVGCAIWVTSNGRIVERGTVADVLLSPSHPYTRQLLSSLPIPDPSDRWRDRISLTEHGATPEVPRSDRCLFAERCPSVMEPCWRHPPEPGPI